MHVNVIGSDGLVNSAFYHTSQTRTQEVEGPNYTDLKVQFCCGRLLVKVVARLRERRKVQVNRSTNVERALMKKQLLAFVMIIIGMGSPTTLATENESNWSETFKLNTEYGFQSVRVRSQGPMLVFNATKPNGQSGDLDTKLECAYASYESFKDSSGHQQYVVLQQYPPDYAYNPECQLAPNQSTWAHFYFLSDAEAQRFIRALKALKPDIIHRFD